MVLTYKASIPKFVIAEGKYIADMQEYLANLLERGTRAAVEAAFARVPVYTGMSKAAFEPLMRRVGLQTVITGIKVARKKGSDYDRSVSHGRDKGIFNFNMGPRFYTMTFSSQVFHFKINDSRKVKNVPESPWGALQKGVDSFYSYIRNEPFDKNAPKLVNYVKVTRKTV